MSIWGKGSFMIYGTRGGWVRNAELGLGIGVRVDSFGEASIIRLITAPPSVISSLVNYYVIVRPGTKDRVGVSREIYDLFRNKIPGFTKVVNLSHIVDAVPGPSVVEGPYEGSPVSWDRLRSLVK